MQATSVTRLKEYACLIQRWENELETEIRYLDEEIVYQMERKRLLLKALGAWKIAAKINAESFACRSTKLDGDCVDEVDEELKKVEEIFEEANTGTRSYKIFNSIFSLFFQKTYLIQDIKIE